jgi:dTDP-4-amino-4,6-dideoxygalactose transaminase
VNAIPFFAGERTWAEHGERHLALMGAALAGGRALQGEPVAAFEAALCARTGRRHTIAVGSGTDALFFALAAAGVRPGDEVIVPAVSFIASASCVLRVGATPVFVDVDDHLLLDLAAAREAVGERTRAVIAVDLYGQMVDPVAAESFAAEHGLVLIEDAAQAVGAEAGGRAAGAVGRASCLSFDPTKTVAAPGSGGAVLCDDDETAAAVRRLRWHGRDTAGAYTGLGFNSQLPSAAAAILADKLGLDATWTARRRVIAARYDAALAGGGATPVGVGGGRTHVFHKYVVRSPRRDAVRAALQAAGVPTLVHYATPLADQPLFADVARRMPCPRAAAACGAVLSLPIHAYLTDAEVDRVCAAVAAAARA